MHTDTSEQSPEAEPVAELARILRARRNEILESWRASVRELPRARALAEPALIDHVPDLLDSIVATTERLGRGESPRFPNWQAEQHAVMRLRVGFDVLEVMRELQMLRHCILRACGQDIGAVALQEHSVLHAAIDDAIAASVARYTDLRERTLEGFDRIAAAGFESADLDELLRRLLHALHDTMPVIGTSAIFIRDGDSLQLRAAVGLDRSRELNRLTMHLGEGFAGTVMAGGEMRVLRHPASTDLKSAVLGAANLKVLYGFPLLEGRQVIGVAEIGSLEADELSDHDLRIIEAMVARATSVIRKQLLRDEIAGRQREFEALGENIPQLALVTDRAGRRLWFNKRWFEYTGMTREQLTEGLPVLIHPDHREAVSEAWEHSLTTGAPFEQLYPLRGADGYYQWFLMRAVPLRDPSGAIERWFATGTDVTERHFLDNATRVLSSSLDYHQTLDQLARLVVPDLADWCIVDVLEGNRLDHVAVVHSDSAMLERTREFLHRHPPDPSHDDGSWQVLRAGRPLVIPEVTTEMLRASARSEEHASLLHEVGFRSWIGAPLVSRGQPIGVLHLVMSTSGRRYREAEVRIATELGHRAGPAVDNARLYREANEAIRQREDVLAIVSHDLRSPLGAIDLGATLLAQAVGTDQRAKKHLEAIRRSAERMAHLIDDLLDMASINAGKLAIHPLRVDAAELVNEVLDMHEPLAAERGITLMRECELEGVTIHVDRARMTQVFSNLLGNALKFCSNGDVIFVRCTREKHTVRFVLSDTGPGIGKAELPHIFQPYWSGRGKKKGTGLGLFITKAIVEAHDGRIEVASDEGQGARFTVTLPLAH